MTVKVQVGVGIKEFTLNQVHHEHVLLALSGCKFESQTEIERWFLRIRDAKSPSSRIAVCRQMVYENPKAEVCAD